MNIMGKKVHMIWIFESSSGGTHYETIQYCNGTTSCNCFGWIKRKPKGEERTCKHTRMVELDTARILCVSAKEYSPLTVELAPVQVRSVPLPIQSSRPTVAVSGPAVVSRKFSFED